MFLITQAVILDNSNVNTYIRYCDFEKQESSVNCFVQCARNVSHPVAFVASYDRYVEDKQALHTELQLLLDNIYFILLPHVLLLVTSMKKITD